MDRNIAYEDLDLPKLSIRPRKRNANLTVERRVTVPSRLWDGYKQWKQGITKKPVT